MAEMSRHLLVWLFVLPLIGQTPYDVLITNARVYDGTGGAWYRADVALRADTIADIGTLKGSKALETIDAQGLALAPGFVDTHSHGRTGIFAYPQAENYVRQGVTTIIEGPDGSSPLPLRPWLEKLAATKIGINFGMLVGHGTIRSQVMGSANRAATAEEMEKMRELARQAMRDGAFGLSTGLFYVPGNYAPTEEVIELGKVVGALGGLHSSHMRDEAAQVVDSVRETIRIGEEGGLPTQVSHHKIIGKANWGLSVQTLKLVEEARQRGVDATIDLYPYTASSTGTGALFPQWSLAGGGPSFRERLTAPESRAKIKAEIARRILEDRGAGDAKNIMMASCGFDAKLAGKNLAEITVARGRTNTAENAAETAIEIQLAGGCSAVYHAIAEEDVERILKSPYSMVASDGGIMAPGRGDVPHPRNYGTFARVLGRYVRERGTLTLEEAVRKMSGFPAARFGLHDRGLIKVGLKADLFLFDPATVGDKADFQNPHQYSVGVRDVWVNGKAVMRAGKMTGVRSGRVLYGPGRE